MNCWIPLVCLFYFNYFISSLWTSDI